MELYEFIKKLYENNEVEMSFEDFVDDFMNANFHVECYHEMFLDSQMEEFLGNNFWFSYELDVENKKITFPIIEQINI